MTITETQLNEWQIRQDDLIQENAVLTQRLLAVDNLGWDRLDGISDNGIPIEQLNQMGEDFESMIVTAPLVSRAVQLRHAYVFGKGMQITGDITGEAKKVLENTNNIKALFSSTAFMSLETSMMTHGNAFVLKRGGRTKTEYIVIPSNQITGVVTDEDDASRIYFVKRTWTVNGKTKHVWIPTSAHKKDLRRGLPKNIKSGTETVPVHQEQSMFILHHRRLTGHTWGIPLGVTIKPYVIMYSGYLKDNATLTKAQSAIAWKVMATSNSQGAKMSTEFVAARDVGNTAVMSGGDITAMPRGNDVNFNNGQPLAAMIATAVGVPVIALLSSTGASGGAYGAATTLDEPTQKGMQAVQQAYKEFYDEILQDLSGENAEVVFPTMSSEAVYRQAQSLANAHATGALFQDEYRESVVDLLDVTRLHDGTPKANGFNTWSDPKAQEKAAASASKDPIAKQGNSGAVPGGVDQGVTNHDNDGDRE